MEVFGDRSIHWGKRVQCDHRHLFFVVKAGSVWIGDDVILGYDVRFLCGSHNYRLRGSDRHPSYEAEPMDIRIEKGAWIASFVTLCGPCTIGEDAVVGAGSVVTCDIPSGELWAGNPARFIKKIDFIN